ncbi:TetR/AcrR family transcriptional regulator [Enterococcus gallinarum]|uniref:TetR/AcrR family transcriptional regulator n=1 Tax=Enterococcus gallinarum TaxID=1353 RepID=UPI001558D069|nr:TetR/AcrR family transcriptional regulator [Enterococcus gallinarum]NQE03945.1 TetR/AcrR family transcriptional regulator [Enterococcus gallinarum]
MKIKSDKKEEILKVALKNFSENGYEKTKLALIAEEAETSTTTIYSFFQTKYGLFEATIEYCLQIINNRLQKNANNADSLADYVESVITKAKDFSVKEKYVLNFYMLITTNTMPIKNINLIENFEKNKFSYYLRFYSQYKNKDRFRILFLDNILNLYVYSFFNDFYREQLNLYLSLYDDQSEASKLFESNLLHYLKEWVAKEND